MRKHVRNFSTHFYNQLYASFYYKNYADIIAINFFLTQIDAKI